MPWAEFCYNPGSHAAVGTTPFEVVYGRPPPRLVNFLPGEVRVQAVADSLWSRDAILEQLRFHLARPQQHMVCAANKHRRDVEFEVGQSVFLKFRPFRHKSLFGGKRGKLAPRYFGPFQIVERVGKAAYRLSLPESSRIHPLFHVSLLKRAVGDVLVSATLPQELLAADPPFAPEAILARRRVARDGEQVDHVLVSWKGFGEDEATWLNVGDVRGQFPILALRIRLFQGGELLMSIGKLGKFSLEGRVGLSILEESSY